MKEYDTVNKFFDLGVGRRVFENEFVEFIAFTLDFLSEHGSRYFVFCLKLN
jgi:hypothetical protein